MNPPSKQETRRNTPAAVPTLEQEERLLSPPITPGRGSTIRNVQPANVRPVNVQPANVQAEIAKVLTTAYVEYPEARGDKEVKAIAIEMRRSLMEGAAGST